MIEEVDVHEIAKKTVRIIAVVLIGGAVVAITLNVIALLYWQPQEFQRLGSLLVAMLVVIFGFGRLIVTGMKSVTEDPSELPVFTLARSDHFLGRRFAPSDDAVEMLKDPSRRYKAHQLLRLIENRIATTVLPSELFWLATATLQWGYGDLFHCWINGEGWTTC